MFVRVVVRIPNNLTDEFSMRLNNLYNSISQKYLENIKKHVQPRKVNVMLADASVTQQDTFEPQNAAMFYETFSRKMKDWSSQGIAKTDTDDLRRLHVLFTTLIENYSLSCYFGIQYHALPFYKLDDKIKDIQMEIMELDEKAAAMREGIAMKENAAIEETLKNRNISNIGFEEMLETIYNDQQLYNELTRKVDDIENTHPDYLEMMQRKDVFVEELKNMIIELYRTKLLLLDHNQLMQGEEGVAVYFDLEVIKKNEKNGAIEIEKIPPAIKQEVIDRFEKVELALKEVYG